MSMQLVAPLGEGFLLGLGLIVGIGPQNSFILQQAVKRQFIITMIMLASVIDVGLIFFGAGGAASFFASSPVLVQLITWSGASFLFLYGAKSFKAALRPEMPTETKTAKPKLERRAVIMGILAVSLLNPSTYLDAMFVIGGSAANYDASLRLCFALGASVASVAWFSMLTFGAASFSKLLRKPTVLRVIDCLSGVIMWFIASRLVLHIF